MPLVGRPAFPFIGQEKSRGYNGREEGEREAEEVLQGCRAFLFFRAGPADMTGGYRDSPTPDVRPLTPPCPSSGQRAVTSRSASAGGAANQRAGQCPYRD